MIFVSSIDETYRISPPPNGVERIPYISWGGTYSIRSIHTTRVYIHTTRVYMQSFLFLSLLGYTFL